MLLSFIILAFIHLCAGRHLQAVPASNGLGMINAKNATIHSIPSIAHMRIISFIKPDSPESIMTKCAGVLIHQRFVLTIATLFNDQTRRVESYFSAYKSDDSDFKYMVASTKWWVHPDYKPDRKANNIAVVMLLKPVEVVPGFIELAKWPPTAVYPANEHVYEGKELSMYGWGRMQQEPKKSPVKMQVLQTKVVPLSECKGPTARAGNTALCLQRADGKTGLGCAGDHGNPLVLDGVVVALYRVSVADCSNRTVSLATRIDYLRPWIEDKFTYHYAEQA